MPMNDDLQKLDAACAQALDLPHELGCPKVADDESNQVLYDYQECVCRWPAFSADPAAVRLLEDEIERRDLVIEYTLALAVLCQVDTEFWYRPNYKDVYQLIHATPEQKARAFLEAADAVR